MLHLLAEEPGSVLLSAPVAALFGAIFTAFGGAIVYVVKQIRSGDNDGRSAERSLVNEVVSNCKIIAASNTEASKSLAAFAVDNARAAISLQATSEALGRQHGETVVRYESNISNLRDAIALLGTIAEAKEKELKRTEELNERLGRYAHDISNFVSPIKVLLGLPEKAVTS